MQAPVSHRKVYSLTFVAKSIQKTIAERYTRSYWIEAELNKLNYYQHSGHCYPELVEKKDNKIVAQFRSTLWKSDYNRINKAFLKLLQEPLKDGIKILFLAKIAFHPSYGMSLNILDIDPVFTLGDLEKEKQESIARLKKEGIFDLNKKLDFPILPQRIAVISVQTSKGYADFLNVLDHAKAQSNYAFFPMLFPSLLQGDQAVKSLKKQLTRIKRVSEHFDIVVIVRGGGGEIGLTCYNHYELAKEIACFPIPVLTGIGHSTNLTVSEMVAHKNSITPTGLAEELVKHFDNFANHLKEMRNSIIDTSRLQLKNCKTELEENANRLTYRALSYCELKNQELKYSGLQIQHAAINQLRQSHNTVNDQYKNLNKSIFQQLQFHQSGLQNLEKNVELLNPKNVLKRGYSISLYQQKPITNQDELEVGSEIDILLYEGKLSAIINSKSAENE